MKKLFPYILIITIIVQLLAPFNISGGIKDNFSIRSNIAEASDDITVTTTASKADTSVIVHVRVVWGKENLLTGGEGVTVTLLDGDKKILETQEVSLKKVDSANLTTGEKLAASVQTGTVTFSGLTPNTTYGIQTFASHQVTSVWKLIKAGALPGSLVMPDITFTTISDPNPLVFITEPTSTTGITQYVDVEEEQTSVNTDAILPVCEITKLGETIGGCIARLLYWGVFQPTSTIFGLTGKLLDITVAYSVKDTSYRSSFVVEGWGVVRDFCNMFFIFILLYIAFATILNLNGANTKEMIKNVVIIGLLMNFSLFAVQVIVDTSNIIARIFYNQQTIVVGPTVNGVVQQRLGSHDEIKLSEAIVAKVNPQKLILKAKQIGSISTKFDTEGDSSVDGHISAKTSILVIILASIVNIVGLIAFLMSSLIFISRVVGLWIAMILAPIAFLSYTVPALQNIEMIGWKRWWPDTLKLAFLAPVFIFFLYLIIKFLDAGLGIDSTNSKTGLDFILGVIVPFVFIMILLMKAKDIAQKMSGTIGESITKVVSGAAGAVALGGAAFAGRQLIGRAGSAIFNSERLKKAETEGNLLSRFGALQLRKFGSYTGKGSMDVRGIKIGGKDLSALAGTNLGEAKKGGFKKWEEENARKQVKHGEELNMSAENALNQDEKVKAYNKKYLAEMTEAKREDESNGRRFNEDNFKAQFETQNGIKPKTSEQINKERLTKYAEVVNKKLVGSSEAKATAVAELKAKGKPAKPELNPLEKYTIEQTRDKAAKSFDNARKELNGIKDNLQNIAEELNLRNTEGNIDLNLIDKNHINTVVSGKQIKVSQYEAEIEKAKAKMAQNPEDNGATAALSDALLNKRTTEAEINKLNSLLTNKEKYEKVQVQEQDTINRQNNLLGRREQTT